MTYTSREVPHCGRMYQQTLKRQDKLTEMRAGTFRCLFTDKRPSYLLAQMSLCCYRFSLRTPRTSLFLCSVGGGVKRKAWSGC